MKTSLFDPQPIAPCGMNCALCSAYPAWKNDPPKVRGKISHCPGCRPRKKQCSFIIKQGPDDRKPKKGAIAFCFECTMFPCPGLERLDGKYRERYGMSMVANLREIKKDGLAKFVKSQAKKYACPASGALRSVHGGTCYVCDEIKSWKG